MNKIPNQVYLWLGVLIFGASGAVTRKLTEIGSQNLINGRNPISLCNVLFVGNLCALLVMLIIYRRQWKKKVLQQISVNNWLVLSVVAILSGALAPSLFFQALALTNVNNVILVGRLEPPLTLALSIWLLKERVNLWEIIGAIAAFIGVSLTIVLQPPGPNMMNMAGFNLGIGEVLATVGAIAAAVATVIGKKYLFHIPLGIFTVFRTALGTIVFFFVALLLYGSHHFMDAFSPFLWQWMLLYSAVIVVLGQSLWFKGLRASTVSVASLVGSFTPIAGILAAYFILDEAPTQAQYLGGSLILVGILISQIGVLRQTRRPLATDKVNSTQVQQIENEMGFKGI
ncbi:DMT family transporter [Nostoc sp. FACHB-152]|uniref:DMT family transporter n=1 Tax=unclassified Nostoc TaxID=2593658 RepID=UPI0016836D64|nr:MULTISPECIES: DMT family transporter [unclassified Nostoc]MBD2448015.1 DMT family transporter [Nostoc sp. FACHB-152]MBD2466122.1 DMT family transporter [Nostoc sp. FACHB-145]